jgi:hypothetical protein
VADIVSVLENPSGDVRFAFFKCRPGFTGSISQGARSRL